MDDILTSLREEYCPPIDSALFSAIASDYDLTQEDNVTRLRETLDPLQAAAAAEEGSELARIASSEDFRRQYDDSSLGDQRSGKALSSSHLGTTGTTSTSRSISSVGESDFDNLSRDAHALSLENLDSDSKTSLLKGMFPCLSEFTIRHTLKKSSGNFDRTVEDLLNQVFFQDEVDSDGEVTPAIKGVDGFAEEVMGTGKKHNQSRKHRKRRADHESQPTPNVADNLHIPPKSKWEIMKQDIDFISSRIHVPSSTVSSVYHLHGAKLSATISALLSSEAENPTFLVNDSELLEPDLDTVHAFEYEFPQIPESHLKALLRLARPSVSAARELASVLTAAAEDKLTQDTGGIEIITVPPPLNLDAPSLRFPAAILPKLPLSHATTLSNAHHTARAQAFTQASSAARKARSNPLYGGAVAYYSSLGHSHDASAKMYASAAADALVASQSSQRHNELDLHGVSVKDAVRIARERVTAWWVGLGDERLGKSGTGRVYRIVTGQGLHSEGGRGRIGPAVGKMLLREGWKVQVGQGTLTVTGVASRK